MNLDTLVIVLAGGKGERLYPLTFDRSKPATPFGSKYRLIDVPLSNAINSDKRQVLVVTQGKDHSLNTHIRNTWQSDPKFGYFVDVISPQDHAIKYEGDADAVRKVIKQIKQHKPRHVLVVPGDHILKMNYSTMMNQMIENNWDAAIAAITQPAIPQYTSQLGAMAIGTDGSILELQEKNPNTTLRANNDPNLFYASMGIYGFNTPVLLDALFENKGHGFGKDVLPKILTGAKVLGYDFTQHNNIADQVLVESNGEMVKIKVERSHDSGYWKDVGTIGQFFDAHMDFVKLERPEFNLYNPLWPFYTHHPEQGPAKFVAGPINAIMGAGAIMTKVEGRDVILFTGAYANNSRLEGVVAFDNADIQNCNIVHSIIDKDTKLRNMEIGYDAQLDFSRGIWVDQESGVRVVPKEYDNTNQKSIDFWLRHNDNKLKEDEKKSRS